MKTLLVYILSYFALLLLAMPVSLPGIIVMVLLLAAGTVLILRKKPTIKKALFSKRSWPAAVLAAAAAFCFGAAFYTRWLPSSALRTVAAILHLPAAVLLLLATVCIAVCAGFVLFLLSTKFFAMLAKEKDRQLFARNLALGFVAAIVPVAMAQLMIRLRFLVMGVNKFFLAVLLVYAVIMLLYSMTKCFRLSAILGTSIFMILSTINAYILSFRGRLFEPVDIFSAGTAMDVASNYNLWPIPRPILIAWIIWLCVMAGLFFLGSKSKCAVSVKKRVSLAVCCVVALVAVICCALGLKTYHWQREGAIYHGYFLDFVSKFKEAHVSKPDGYSTKQIDELAEKYAPDPTAERTPHIIVIMDEAFSDLSVHGDLNTDQEVMPFISSMKENVVSGYALVSAYGGNTANSEFEFLTGNSMAWLSPNVVPYQQYLHSSSYSMVSYLKHHFDYQCIAMHPYHSTCWNRPATYKNFGFDESLFMEDFPQKNLIRDYISDREMFEQIVEVYEEHKAEPLFLFGVSMQNHGDYTYSGSNFDPSVSLVGYKNEYPDMEQYLSLIHETDRAVEYLVSYFSEVEDDVVIVLFGDHQPRADTAFYNELGTEDANTFDARQKQYLVPFFVWTNYDSEEQFVDCTSLNYLSSYVYQSAGISLPPYNQFLTDMQKSVPAINAHCFYSSQSGCFLPFEEATGQEKLWLQLYERLQYNNLFDKKHRNSDLFVTLK